MDVYDRRDWHLLPASHADLPLLLVSAVFDFTSYSVHLTDLAHVWSEHLDHRAICMRALKENTPIDPSYDSEQMGILLGKLRASFDTSHPDYVDTQLSLSSDIAKNTEIKNTVDITLQITATLPEGLQSLHWPMYLHRQINTAIAPELVFPLIHNLAFNRQERAVLISALHEKDAVIAKLTEKLDALGSGIESAFPSLAASAVTMGGARGGSGSNRGRRKMSRSDIERRIKGLAPFDEVSFESHISTMAVKTNSEIHGMVSSVFGNSTSALHCDADKIASFTQMASSLYQWWHQLKDDGNALPLSKTMVEENTIRACGSIYDRSQSNDSEDTAHRNEHLLQHYPERLAHKIESIVTEQSLASMETGDITVIGQHQKKAHLGRSPKPATPFLRPVTQTGNPAATSNSGRPGSLEIRVPSDSHEEPPSKQATTERRGLGRICGKKKATPSNPIAESNAGEDSKKHTIHSLASQLPTHIANESLDGICDVAGGTNVSALGHQMNRGKGGGKDTAIGEDIQDETLDGSVKLAVSVMATDVLPHDKAGMQLTRKAVLQQAVEKHAAPVWKKRKF